MSELNQTVLPFQELRQLLASGKPEEGGTASVRWPESLFEVPVPIRCLNADSHFDADFWQMNDTEVWNFENEYNNILDSRIWCKTVIIHFGVSIL